MAEIHDVYGSICQNLRDAGCNTETTNQCMDIVKEGRSDDILPVLLRHREFLLDSLHARQKQIDCLDFLIYKLKNKKEDFIHEYKNT